MSRNTTFAMCMLAWSSILSGPAQGQQAQTPQQPAVRVLVGAPGAGGSNDAVVPPSTSWTISLDPREAKATSFQAADMDAWVHQQDFANGLQGLSVPWRIVIGFEQFDEDGDKVHSGTFEEVWLGPRKYRTSYQADDLTQTDYATAQGLYRRGDQKWPNRAQVAVAAEVISPFAYAATLQHVRVGTVAETFSGHAFQCARMENGPGRSPGPTEYCFESAGLQLRYSRGWGWHQTTYNDLITFQGRTLARTVDVYDGGKPYLKLRVQRLEAATDGTDAELIPPADAVNLSGQRLTGVVPVAIKQSGGEWPDSMREQHFVVVVDMVVGKDGRVREAHAISGPQGAYKAAESAARTWVFKPYLVLGEPAEVSMKINLSNN